MRGEPLLRARGASAGYRGDAVVRDVDLELRAGEVHGLIGPNGAGKSTLLALFGGLLRPSAGRIHVGEHELSVMSEAEIDAFRAGERVTHPIFGTGVVVASRPVGGDEEVTVAFADQGVKRLMAQYARLERAG